MKASCELQCCPPGTSKGSYPFTHSMNPHLHPRLYHGCYGDIMGMETSGAACDITRLMNCGNRGNSLFSTDLGIRGSEMFAEMDLRALKTYQTLIKEVGLRHCVDPALIAAVISRENHGRAVLQEGWDHRGLKFGLMQVQARNFNQAPSSFLTEAQLKLEIHLQYFQALKHPGGLSAFKSGIDAIATPEDIDNDLVNDLLARAKFYRRHGF
ncbi:hypothetical protein MC885_012307 [Smutsia gigantea]|nr:hypothetical protein MC885_012307 [Smutsia gigantea]